MTIKAKHVAQVNVNLSAINNITFGTSPLSDPHPRTADLGSIGLAKARASQDYTRSEDPKSSVAEMPSRFAIADSPLIDRVPKSTLWDSR